MPRAPYYRALLSAAGIGGGLTINLMQGTASGCKPLLDLKGERRCTDLMRFLVADFIPEQPVDVILLLARWAPPTSRR